MGQMLCKKGNYRTTKRLAIGGLFLFRATLRYIYTFLRCFAFVTAPRFCAELMAIFEGVLGGNEFKKENVDIAFGKPEGGKVKVKATPKDPTAKQFFMRVKMK